MILLFQAAQPATTPEVGASLFEIMVGLAAIFSLGWSLLNSWNVNKVKSAKTDTEQTKDIAANKAEIEAVKAKIQDLIEAQKGNVTKDELNNVERLIQKDFQNIEAILSKIGVQVADIHRDMQTAQMNYLKTEEESQATDKRIGHLEKKMETTPTAQQFELLFSRIESLLK